MPRSGYPSSVGAPAWPGRANHWAGSLAALGDVVDQALAVDRHGQGAAHAHIIHDGRLGVEPVVVGAQLRVDAEFLGQRGVGLDPVQIGQGHVRLYIQVAGFVLGQLGRRIQHRELHFIELRHRDVLGSGPEGVLDEGDRGVVDPFLDGERAVGLEEAGLDPALAAGLGAVVPFDEPLRLGVPGPHAGDGRVVGRRLLEGHLQGGVIQSP